MSSTDLECPITLLLVSNSGYYISDCSLGQVFIDLPSILSSMEGTERITLRLPADSIILLKSMVDDGDYHDISEAVRDAIDSFIKSRMTVEEMIEARSRCSMEDVSLDDLVSSDDDIDAAIKDAVKAYLERKLE